MQAVVADGDSAYGTWDDYTKASGFEAYDDELSYTSFAKDMVKRADRIRTAGSISPCTVPVVLRQAVAERCGMRAAATHLRPLRLPTVQVHLWIRSEKR